LPNQFVLLVDGRLFISADIDRERDNESIIN
jgi:hypothetical protein